MPAERIAEGVHRLRLGRTNAYLIEPSPERSSAVLVDSGLPSHLPAILGILAEFDLLDLDDRRARARLGTILLTHRHLDHVGSAAGLAARTGARVVIHRADSAAVLGCERLSPIRRGVRGQRLLEPLVALSDRRVFRFRPCTTVWVIEGSGDGHDDGRDDDGDSLPSGFAAIHTPGHTPGHCAFYYRPAAVVFCGDLAVSSDPDFRYGRAFDPPPPVELRSPSKIFTVDPAALAASQRLVAELNAKLLCFGHGRPTSEVEALGQLASG